MNKNTVSNHYNYSLGAGHGGGQKGEPCPERDHFLPSVSYYASVISHLLSQPDANAELDPSLLLPSSQKTELLFQRPGNSTSSRETSSLSQLPVYDLSHPSRFHNEHLQAKRARVENIIRGMSIMPNAIVPDLLGEGDQHQVEKEKENYRENRRKQKIPQQQSPHETSLARPGRIDLQAEECLQLKKQLHLLQHQLKQLQERFLQPYELSDSSPSQSGTAKTAHLLKEALGQHLDNSNQGVASDPHTDNLWRRIPKMGGSKLSEEGAEMRASLIPTPEERTLSEILKHELIQVVTQAVDSVLKKVLSKPPGSQSPLNNSPPVSGSSTGRGCRDESEESTARRFPPKASSQKGSISLVTSKSPGFPEYRNCSKTERTPCQALHVNYPLVMTSEASGNGILSQMLVCGQNDHWGSPPPRMVSSPEALDVPWQPIKLKSSFMRHQQYPVSYKSAEMGSLAPLPASNTEFAEVHAVMNRMPFASTHIREALTPSHLKKAKLMFFFTRYPTSSLLKAYFPDVQFTRCITSQLIKWFSNFREFYYIQMEKFARQAILEGVTDVNDLIVLRASELFRTLNAHYNKGNDFEVPDGFLDVASLTLQEFFSAIRAGKDLDPSWKKPIYKIISKLDSEIPDAFKASSCPPDLTQS
ncbi:prospero homeobox protein 2 [Hemicordylus capensis]|uniref:prospero homeobox protein 2 n=1 Tax=Hemicordylus capensis TaxID=884348 RepID=UPI002304823E|nr:prospero homeobox protein 2 [Hemicordylus capensis]XP_053167047.1 prospero homeobox protein 2 [Hemicordylus capensis]XP_053167055.1 prospero homeobox protein 2 [Hemicordylus capensis]XP_053167061.1 prospero homeobox protein 2 [Hemicordylus capensis]XP_053167067.1 prospero homeobox protein 2 [Hemicordylus capensis]